MSTEYFACRVLKVIVAILLSLSHNQLIVSNEAGGQSTCFDAQPRWHFIYARYLKVEVWVRGTHLQLLKDETISKLSLVSCAGFIN